MKHIHLRCCTTNRFERKIQESRFVLVACEPDQCIKPTQRNMVTVSTMKEIGEVQIKNCKLKIKNQIGNKFKDQTAVWT